ncbi:hypothetical protein CVT25_003423 [Psilocybe cyanescens]|uniref:Sm protein G n=1 Tax=Psilocybe cyanescens TaxID=93625 RepID=A0A409WM50_PSICY|nr:hypothetical protein CVT25_003423 [Psilocybe cyanescens]
MSKASQPELKKFMDKKLFVHLQGGRKVSGVLRGYDLFLNLVIDDAMEESTPAQKHPIGTVVIRVICAMKRRVFSHSILRNYRTAISSLSRSYSVDFTSTLSATQQLRFKDLANALAENTTDPSYVWANYSNLLALLGSEPLPLEIHQQVLRHCTPSVPQLRRSQVQQLDSGKHDFLAPDVEVRFQTLLRNIRSIGAEPSLGDYNFIIEQFAAYGHYEGTLNVYEEIKRAGITPDHRTYGFCLRALAYRLSLPVDQYKRPALFERIQNLFKMYMDDMRNYNVPMTGLNLEVSLRIMKETLDRKELESILRRGYAVDLANLDRIPLEYTENRKDNPEPFPFTTAVLNTTLEILGMLGDVSKLVQAFEVLTQPLPQASQHFFNSFESDEEGDFGVDVDASPPFPMPSAMPNTTTYTIMLRHLCRLGHSILARHYILDARTTSKAAAIDLRLQVQCLFAKKKPLDSISAPRVAISRMTLLPAMGEANRDKNLGLIKWLTSKVPTMIQKQQQALKYYSLVFDTVRNPSYHKPHRRMRLVRSVLRSSYPGMTPEEKAKLAVQVHARPTEYTYKELFEVDIKDPPPPPTTQPSELKPFNIRLHILILKRNIIELEDLNKNLRMIYGRTVQRVKERLGRRVWQTKDIFLRTEEGRVEVTKNRWKEIVNFRTTAPDEPEIHRKRPTYFRRMSTLTIASSLREHHQHHHSRLFALPRPSPILQRHLDRSSKP